MENKLKAPSIVLKVLFILSAAVLVMFYGFGYGTQETINGNTLTAPSYTGLLVIWIYALVAICSLVVFAFAIVSGVKNRRTREKGERRRSWIAPTSIFTIVIIVLSFVLASDAPVRTGDGLFEDTSLLKMADVCLYSIYALMVTTIVCTGVSMAGIFKSRK